METNGAGDLDEGAGRRINRAQRTGAENSFAYGNAASSGDRARTEAAACPVAGDAARLMPMGDGGGAAVVGEHG
jgi:hypothetical protein